MDFLYFGGTLDDREKGRTKIGETGNLLSRGSGYGTGSALSNYFSYWFVASIITSNGRNAEFWEQYFLREFPEDETIETEELNRFSGEEFRLKVSFEKVKEIMIKFQGNDVYHFYQGDEIEILLQNKRPTKICLTKSSV